MSQCLYSPDLSPNDFFVFPNVKQKMRGHPFSSPQEVVKLSKTMFLRYQLQSGKKMYRELVLTHAKAYIL